MKKVLLALFIFSTLLLPYGSYAQFGKSPMPKFRSDFKPVVGGWSEYQVISKGESPTKMKMAVVGKEGDAYWFETVMDDRREGKAITKMLVSGDPDDQNNVKRIIIKMGNQPAMEMPVQVGRETPKSVESTKGKLIDKGTETIKVPAGTFKTNHYQYQDGGSISDTWVYRDVSPYGLIKSQSKNFEMVLVGYGTGAKTLITEKPQKFQMPQMPQIPSMGKMPHDDEDDDD